MAREHYCRWRWWPCRAFYSKPRLRIPSLRSKCPRHRTLLLATDPAWSQAKPIRVALSGGVNFKGGKTTATIKAVYSGDMGYMLVQYDDPTESIRRSPYQKQPDGSWKKVTDPKDKGGDNNVYYEDKFALIWNIGNSIKGFSHRAAWQRVTSGRPVSPSATSTRE